MTRCANADDFAERLRAIRSDYEKHYSIHIATLRAQLDAKQPRRRPDFDQALEEHRREYVVNCVLAALNWRMDISREVGLPNLVPEVSVRSAQTGRSIRMDYLGLDSDADTPLMVVETKSPRDGLPELQTGAASTYSGVIAQALCGAKLKGSWTTWLNKLTDYIKSTARRASAPTRALITNGEWYIIFLNPSSSFLSKEEADESAIVVFDSFAELQRRANDAFQNLEHSRVLGRTPALRAEQLAFVAGSRPVARLAHGLMLRYSTAARVYESSPSIVVAPVLFVRFTAGAWFCVRAGPQDFAIPTRCSDLVAHLNDVEFAAKQLLDEVRGYLCGHVDPLPLEAFYEEELASGALLGVREREEGVFELVTGDRTHYLKSGPSIRDCKWHSFSNAFTAGCAHGERPILLRSLNPRSFFCSEEPHHCSHASVRNAKASPVDEVNRASCGPRSAKNGGAFCEIWRFETHLCCRACTYEEVCTKARVLRLPCVKPVSKDGS